MIPISFYAPLFYHVLLIVVFLTCFIYWSQAEGHTPAVFNKSFAVPLLVIIVLYMGLRPISVYFGDMASYAKRFCAIQSVGASYLIGEGEWIFQCYMYLCGLVMNVEAWFVLTAALYTGLMAVAFYKVHRQYAFTVLLFAAATYSFWSYGTNGIRNGLATSLVVLAISLRHGHNKWTGLLPMAALLFLAANIHKSTLLPILCFLLTFLCNRPAIYLLGWCVSIVLSLAMGGFWENFFTNLQILEDARIANYLQGEVAADTFSRVGFRWDFVLYSLFPLALGWYYIFKKHFQDPFYFQLFNTYVAANAAWVLVCRAAFSNRFAYLSWFLIPWVIAYPLVSQRFMPRQWSKTATILLVYYAITYVLTIVFGR